MKTYLVSGYLYFKSNAPVPFCGTAVTEPGEVMDLKTLRRVEEIVLAEHLAKLPPNKVPAYNAGIASFQPFETSAVAQPAAEPHLNECSVVLPPVDSPLLIEIAPGMLLKAKRPAHAEQREDLLLFDLDVGGMYIGRPKWTHP